MTKSVYEDFRVPVTEFKAIVSVEDGRFILFEFPDLPGCQTFYDLHDINQKKPLKVVMEALEGHIETLAMLAKPVPKPLYDGPGVIVVISQRLENKLKE